MLRYLYVIMVLAAVFLFGSATVLLAATEPSGSGTGFVVHADGYLLTCAHVVADAERVEVTLAGKTYKATVLGVDAKRDLAVLHIPAKGLPALPLANSNAVEVGQEARAVGYPLSTVLGDDVKVTRGTVAGISVRAAERIFQIDAAVNPGNSGGPLVNEAGEAIGVVNAKLVFEGIEGVGFAVPINYAKPLLRDDGVDYTSGTATTKLDGPALVKCVSPSVALIRVWVQMHLNPKDGATIIYVPAGEFLMGSKVSERVADLERPQRQVYLDAYYVYKTEVTVAQYRKFCQATGRKMADEPPWKWQESHPIVNVSWADAAAYAEWAGAALPTEAQWEKAARGTDGRVYPWGNDWDGANCVNNTQSTKPVGSIPAGASRYGCLDMAGNVWEWCADWYDEDYYKNAPVRNPTGPANGTIRVVRGGGWNSSKLDSNTYFCRAAFRYKRNPTDRYSILGFRCVVRSPEP